ncbi:MAG: hypothetical protein HKN26_08135 [Acidimicrobiales bacterium]|nr:hypothetical protein [Acidimicrobiales bacterium]
MGQVVRVIERPSSRPGIVRFETNRVLTGMGHERYQSRADAVDDTPSDELARRLFDRGGVQSLHINSNIITVTLATADSSGIREIIEDLYTYWQPGMEPPTDEELVALVEE